MRRMSFSALFLAQLFVFIPIVFASNAQEPCEDSERGDWKRENGICYMCLPALKWEDGDLEVVYTWDRRDCDELLNECIRLAVLNYDEPHQYAELCSRVQECMRKWGPQNKGVASEVFFECTLPEDEEGEVILQ